MLQPYHKRAKLKYEIQDYTNALKDYEAAILSKPGMILPYFGRANTRLKLIELTNTEYDEYYLFNVSTDFDTPADPYSKTIQLYSYEEVLKDYDRVIGMDPDFYYAWYNRGNIRALMGDYWGAISDFTRALEIAPDFSYAFYNKGLLLIYLNLKGVGCKDISQAGELGIEEAYPVLKRYCVK